MTAIMVASQPLIWIFPTMAKKGPFGPKKGKKGPFWASNGSFWGPWTLEVLGGQNWVPTEFSWSNGVICIQIICLGYSGDLYNTPGGQKGLVLALEGRKYDNDRNNDNHRRCDNDRKKDNNRICKNAKNDMVFTGNPLIYIKG